MRSGSAGESGGQQARRSLGSARGGALHQRFGIRIRNLLRIAAVAHRIDETFQVLFRDVMAPAHGINIVLPLQCFRKAGQFLRNPPVEGGTAGRIFQIVLAAPDV